MSVSKYSQDRTTESFNEWDRVQSYLKSRGEVSINEKRLDELKRLVGIASVLVMAWGKDKEIYLSANQHNISKSETAELMLIEAINRHMESL